MMSAILIVQDLDLRGAMTATIYMISLQFGPHPHRSINIHTATTPYHTPRNKTETRCGIHKVAGLHGKQERTPTDKHEFDAARADVSRTRRQRRSVQD